MKQFIIYLLTKLGLGIGAVVRTPDSYINSFIKVFNTEDVIKHLDNYTYLITVDNKTIRVKLTTNNNVVTNIEVL